MDIWIYWIHCIAETQIRNSFTIILLVWIDCIILSRLRVFVSPIYVNVFVKGCKFQAYSLWSRSVSRKGDILCLMISVTIALSEKQPCKLASYDKHGLLRAYFIPSPRKILASFDNKNNVMIYAHLLRWNKLKM